MLIGQAAVDACKVGVTIAVRYGVKRPQFGDRAVMGYVTHQRRLLPALATTYAMHLAMLQLKVRGGGRGWDSKEARCPVCRDGRGGICL